MECHPCLCVFVVIFAGLGPLAVTARCTYPKEISGVLMENWDKDHKVKTISELEQYLKSLKSSSAHKTFINSLDVPNKRKLAYFARRLRTYFLAPQTGDYLFNIACDDFCRLKLSTDDNLENLKTLVDIPKYIAYQKWQRYNNVSVRLSKGHSYLLEVIWAQNKGAYHMTVGVQLPDERNMTNMRPVSNELLKTLGDWGAWSQCSRTCGKGTQSRNRSCLNPPPVYRRGNTTETVTETRICQPLKPCSVPHSNIQVRSSSSTSLLVTWKSEWQDHWPEELLSFHITYMTKNGSAQNKTVDGSLHSLELRGLAVYTQYCVIVQLVTLAGVGRESPCVYATTEQDVPCSSPTRVVAHNHTSPTKIRVTWKALSKTCWQGIPRGYSVRLQVNETEYKTWSKIYFVRPIAQRENGVLLHGLQSYTTYNLQVAALTDKGHGSYSEVIHVETCRCPRKFFVNWMQVPPLCFKSDEANVIVQPEGFLPKLLRNMISHVCGTCHRERNGYRHRRTAHDHRRTALDFREETASFYNITSTLSTHTQLTLPISMAPNLPFAREEWVFLPVVRVAGVAVLMKKPNPGEMYAGKLGSSVLDRWPVFLMMFVLYCVFGLAVWTVEKSVNQAQFPPRFTRGWHQGLWWAIVTMTTVGYGHHYPITVPGRLLAVASLVVGVVMNALFISTLTSSLTVFVINEAANPERGSKIGVVTGSVENSLGMRMNGSKGIKSISYPTRDTLLQGLKSHELDGALMDVLTVDTFKKKLNDFEFEVVKILPSTFYYGIILTGDARYLLKDFKEYLTSRSIESLIKQPQVTLQEKEDDPDRVTKPTQQVQTVIPFFEPENSLFQLTVKITVAALFIGVNSGLLYHLIWTRLKHKRGQSRDPGQELAAVKAEMTQLLDEFHKRIKQTYDTLKIKHRRELLQFRERRSVNIVTTSYCRKGSSIGQHV